MSVTASRRFDRDGRLGKNMAFVKLDCGMLDSTIWVDRAAREVFVTALLMARPFRFEVPVEQLEVRALKQTGFVLPAGWYGLVEAAGTGIVRRAGLELEEGLSALERLGAPDAESRTPHFDGRRLIRVDGGYVVLNYMRYREKDGTAKDRAARYREKKKRHAVTGLHHAVTERVVTPESRRVTQAEAEAEAHAEKTVRTTTCPAVAGPVGGEVVTDVDLVIQHYGSYHPTAKPGKRERTLIDGRLKEGFTVPELCEAIDGQHRSPHHLGQNDRGTKYLGLELAVRDSAKVNQFRSIAAQPTEAERDAEIVERVAAKRGINLNGSDQHGGV